LARERNPNRDKAFEVYKNHDGKITPRAIAEELNEKVANIRVWKTNDKWDEKLGLVKSKRGAPKNNANAIGNKGGDGAPKGNINAFKHGEYIPQERFNSKKFLAKYLPKVTANIMSEIHDSGMNSLDILWMNIEIHLGALIRSQKIMHVTSKNDMTKTLKRIKVQNELQGPKDNKELVEVYREEEYDIQYAWDKQGRFIAAQSKGFKTLTEMIKTYEELLHKNWNLATEEQKLRVQVLKSSITSLEGGSSEGIEEFIKATHMSEEEVSNLFEGDEDGQEKETD
jgi:uncharacterized protein YjcR